jgi:hypothetical protein
MLHLGRLIFDLYRSKNLNEFAFNELVHTIETVFIPLAGKGFNILPELHGGARKKELP